MTIGNIKYCNKCKREVYVRTDEKCQCGNDFETNKKNESFYVISYLGKAEISRRTLVQMQKEGMI